MNYGWLVHDQMPYSWSVIAVGRPVTRPPPHRSRRAVFPHRAPQMNSLPHEGQTNEATTLVRIRLVIRGRGSWKCVISSWKPCQLKLQRWLRRFSHFHRSFTDLTVKLFETTVISAHSVVVVVPSEL